MEDNNTYNETTANISEFLDISNNSAKVIILHAGALAAIDCLLMLCILIGNGCTMSALRLGRRLRAIVANKYICSLACSDLLVGLMLPYHLAFYIGEDVWLAKHKETCLLRFVMISLACCASLYNILLIAIDRYVAIVHPLRYTRYATHQNANYLITIGWSFAIAMATAPLYWNTWHEVDHQNTNSHEVCELYTVLKPAYIIFVLSPAFATVWLAMLLLYCRIWREARGHAIRMRNTSSQQLHINDKKSIQVVFLVLGSFSLCWLPYFTLILAALRPMGGTLIGHAPSVAYECAFTLAMANSALNPLIYAWKNRTFRKALLRLLKCQSPNQPDDETEGIYPIRKNNSSGKFEMQNLEIQQNKDKNGQILNSCNKSDNICCETDFNDTKNDNFEENIDETAKKVENINSKLKEESDVSNKCVLNDDNFEKLSKFMCEFCQEKLDVFSKCTRCKYTVNQKEISETDTNNVNKYVQM